MPVSLGGVRDGQLPPRVGAREGFEGAAGLLERIRVLDLHAQRTGIQEGRETLEVLGGSRCHYVRAASYRTVVLLTTGRQWRCSTSCSASRKKGLGRDTDFVFTTETGKPYCRNRVSKCIARAAKTAGLGMVGAQVLRRSAATLRAYAGVPKHVAAKEMGHTPTVFERSYAKVYEDAQDMEETRKKLSSIGFGVSEVDQSLTNGS